MKSIIAKEKSQVLMYVNIFSFQLQSLLQYSVSDGCDIHSTVFCCYQLETDTGYRFSVHSSTHATFKLIIMLKIHLFSLWDAENLFGMLYLLVLSVVWNFLFVVY